MIVKTGCGTDGALHSTSCEAAVLQDNAVYTVFSAHPVLGSIMAVVASRTISRGEEVLVNYDYEDPGLYQTLGIK